MSVLADTCLCFSVFEDALDREIDELGVDDSIPAVGHGMDPPTVSDATVSTCGTPQRATALAGMLNLLCAGVGPIS